jgi:NTE family protein
MVFDLVDSPVRSLRARQLITRLINWGYAVCDANLPAYVDPNLSKPTRFPYQTTGV